MSSMESEDVRLAMTAAFEEAQKYVGATAPNPPVGACALDKGGKILGVDAHPKAGEGHAEARLLKSLEAKGLLNRIDLLCVTLEPCNHFGRTPPCSEAVVKAGVPKVVYGAFDPNPKVSGSGAKRIRDAGIEIKSLSEFPELSDLELQIKKQLAPFLKWITEKKPFVVLKQALYRDSMVPPQGQKTFTSPESLRFAHVLRRETDAIITGSGTVIADRPEFNVRLVPDHQGRKPRTIAVLDRSEKVKREAPEWILARERAGFEVIFPDDLESALSLLGEKGCLSVLVEAGPALSQSILDQGLWDRHVRIEKFENAPDQITDLWK